MKNLNEKGFTLIETLVVISILSIVLSVSIWGGIKLIDKSKEKSYQVTLNNIETISKNYMQENIDKFTFLVDDNNSEYFCITIQDLVDMGYFKNNIIGTKYGKKDSEILSKNSYIYIERDKYQNINSTFLKPNDPKNEKCGVSGANQYGIIKIDINPLGFAKSKEAIFTFNVNGMDDSDENNYSFKYKIDDDEYHNIPGYKGITLNRNCKVYGAIFKGNKLLKQASKEVNKIDNESPSGAVFLNQETENTNKLSIDSSKVEDKGCGIKTIEYGISTSNSCTNVKYQKSNKFTTTKSGNHYGCVRAIDKLDNEAIIRSEPKNISMEEEIIHSYHCNNKTEGILPYAMNYTGDCEVIDDGNKNYRIKFLTSGILTFSSDINNAELFLVGGGGAGSKTWPSGGGGGGGYVNQGDFDLQKNVSYILTIGAGGVHNGGDGQATSIKEGSTVLLEAHGGVGGGTNGGAGGSGGGGGVSNMANNQGDSCYGVAGGSNGNNGVTSAAGFCKVGEGGKGIGENKTTKEFGEEKGDLYAGGGGSGGYPNGGSGGSGGGGNGGCPGINSCIGNNGDTNTGGGGGGSCNGFDAGNGGTGIIVLRNDRSNKATFVVSYKCANISKGLEPYAMNYTGNCEIIPDGQWDYRIRFLTSGKLTLNQDFLVDLMLVGGGGGGSGGYGINNDNRFEQKVPGGGGGAGGHVFVKNSEKLEKNHEYNIVIGQGGTGGEGGPNYKAGGTGGKTKFEYDSKNSYYALGGEGGAKGGAGGGGEIDMAKITTNGGVNGAHGGSGGGWCPFDGNVGYKEFNDQKYLIEYAGGGGGGYPGTWDNNIGKYTFNKKDCWNPWGSHYGRSKEYNNSLSYSEQIKGNGGSYWGYNGNSAADNSGGGGGGGGAVPSELGQAHGGNGGSGVVSIRNHR